MQIFIKTLTGRRSNFNFEPDNTVRQVKEALQEKEGIQVEQIRLIYSGKQMNDDVKLQEYQVKPGSTIHMVLQLRGGRRRVGLPLIHAYHFPVTRRGPVEPRVQY